MFGQQWNEGEITNHLWNKVGNLGRFISLLNFKKRWHKITVNHFHELYQDKNTQGFIWGWSIKKRKWVLTQRLINSEVVLETIKNLEISTSFRTDGSGFKL